MGYSVLAVTIVTLICVSHAFHGLSLRSRCSSSAMGRPVSMSSASGPPSLFDTLADTIRKLGQQPQQSGKMKGGKTDLKIYDEEIDSCTAVMRDAVRKEAPPSQVIENLMSLEKLMRKKNRLDDNATSRETLANLNGAWRLVFTTGTVDSQKKIGKINYFPIKAVQCFNTETQRISNGIYIGNYAVLKFFGQFEWVEKARKLEFDFDKIQLFSGALSFPLKSGEAAALGSSTGLGSEGNVELAKKDKKAFFNWISADGDIATARGGGGGLALWRKDVEMQAIEDIFVTP